MIDRLIRGSRDFSRFYALPATFKRFNSSIASLSLRSSNLSTEVVKQIARDTARGFKTTAHHGVMALGICAIGILGVMFVRPDVMDQLKALSPFQADTAANIDNAKEEGVNAQARVGSGFNSDISLAVAHDLPALTANEVIEARRLGVSPLLLQQAALGAASRNALKGTVGNRSVAFQMQPAIPTQFVSFPVAQPASGNQPRTAYKQQELVTNWLAKKYRVASEATDMLVSAAYSTAHEIKLDPLLILSVMAIESGFNPFAESPVGAQGLMQVMSKVHHEKFQHLGGLKAALNPLANIKVGSLILKDYVNRGGSVEAGLKLYVGAAAFDNDSGYGSKVLAEYHRLQDVAVGKTVNVGTPVFTAKAKPVVKTADTQNTLPGKEDNAATPSNDSKPEIAATVAAI